MASLPRIITVDPTGNIPAQVRAAFDLLDRLVVQIDVPGPTEALEELERGGIDVVIAAWNPGNGMQGWELAAKVKQIAESVAIILMGDYEDTDLDEEMADQSPFVYLKRPFDIPQLIRVLQAALDGGDLRQALTAGSGASVSTSPQTDMGTVPSVNADKADEVMQGVMGDLNPIGAFLANRDGNIIVGRTTMGEVDYDYMAARFAHTMHVNIDLRDTIGGNTQTLHFYDGDDYDVFVVSVGLHHFLALIFDGKEGARLLGAVTRFGRRRAEDLIAVIGPSAFFIQTAPPVQEKQPEVRRKSDRARKTEENAIPELARADLGGSDSEAVEEDATPAVPEPMAPLFDAIDDDAFDPDALFGDDFDETDADDLFSLDAMGEIAQEDGKKGTLDWDRARELGILDE